MIAHFDGGDTFSNGLNNATAFVAQDGREIPLGIGAGQCVGVCVADAGGNDTHQHLLLRRGNVTSTISSGLLGANATAARDLITGRLLERGTE